MKQYKTYLFDVDGTLLDTTELIFQSFLNTCRKYANFEIKREEVYKHIGIPLRTQLELYLGKKSDTEYEDLFNEHRLYQQSIYKKTLKAYSGVVEGLAKLKEKDVQMGVVSSRTRDSLDRYLKYVGIFDLFSVISTPEITKNHKPHPEPVLWALEQFGAKAADTIFIGDATVDIKSGNSAGVDTAFVSWGHNSIEDIKSEPDYIVNHFDELFAR
ncbi:MAG: HAD-IA family hydrolase [Spirochaetaceae bacterium]|nr:HAD-IA family hydrolase [Spirochaetaceae bacterium]